MIELDKQNCLGDALRQAMRRFASETCLIEADRERENCRYTYQEFDAEGRRLARGLQGRGFGAGDRAGIIMTNQSKWLLSAYAIFFRGGVLVPLDYKLNGREHLELLQHAGVKALVVEFPFWRNLQQEPALAQLASTLVIVCGAPVGQDLAGAVAWEDLLESGEAEFEERRRDDAACIVYSSGTGGRPKGCVLLHRNYLEQCKSLTGLYAFWPGVRYLSILPTNHAIDFMVGFVGPFVCGATVVHLRTLRPEFVREAFPKYKITYMALVPMVLKNLERGLRQRIENLPPLRRWLFNGLKTLNYLMTRNRPKVELSRRLLAPIHRAFGGELRAFFVGGAFTEPETLEFFYELGIPVANGYGLTEAGTVVTVNDMRPFRSDTVGKPLPGTEVRIQDADAEGIGEVVVRGPTVMSHYLDDPELTNATIVDGWLQTGDQGCLDAQGHLQLFGRKKNMIVTSGGKNIYPEDIENAFVGLPVKEYCVFAVNYLWQQRSMTSEQLVIVLHLEPGQEVDAQLVESLEQRNRRLSDFKRVHRYLLWKEDFPRTASMKIKRNRLADQIREKHSTQQDALRLEGASSS